MKSILRWFGYVLCRPTDAPVCKHEPHAMVNEGVERKRDRPKITWKNVVLKRLTLFFWNQCRLR